MVESNHFYSADEDAPLLQKLQHKISNLLAADSDSHGLVNLCHQGTATDLQQVVGFIMSAASIHNQLTAWLKQNVAEILG